MEHPKQAITLAKLFPHNNHIANKVCCTDYEYIN